MKSVKEIDVSVIVVHYEQAQALKLILGSLANQKFAGKVEIIVTDDGSTLQTISLVKKYLDKTLLPFSLVSHKKDGARPGKARNNGIKVARGKHLLFLDGDMVPKLDLVQKHWQAHQQKEKLIVAGNRIWKGELKLIKPDITKLPTKQALQKLAQHKVDPTSLDRQKGEIARRNSWVDSPEPWRACFSCNLSVANKKEVLFDENFCGFSNEDLELAWRLFYKHDYLPLYLPQAAAFHLETPKAVMNIYRGAKHKDIVRHLRNIVYFYDKCPGLALEDVFYGFPRISLNSDNEWEVRERPQNFTPQQLREKVDEIRTWLKESGVYDKS